MNEDCTHEYGLPYETAKKLYSVIDEIEQAAIGKLPIGEFVTLKESKAILGKQFKECIQHRERMLMIHIIGGVRFLYKPSLLQFIETGDGRILIGK